MACVMTVKGRQNLNVFAVRTVELGRRRDRGSKLAWTGIQGKRTGEKEALQMGTHISGEVSLACKFRFDAREGRWMAE
jgi:hypothetical protein